MELHTFGPSFHPTGNRGSAPGDERMKQGLGKQRKLPSEKEDKLTQIKPVNVCTNMINSEFLTRIPGMVIRRGLGKLMKNLDHPKLVNNLVF